VTAPVLSKSPPRPARRTDRRWLIAIPLLLAVLGGLAGLAAGTGSKASAVALLLVRYDAGSGGTAQAAADNAAAQLNTRAVFNAAAEKTGGDASNIQARTSIAARSNSQIVSISVTAPTTAQALQEANAVAEAGVGIGPNQVPGALTQLTQATRDLISSEQLRDPAAERSRVERLGDALGASQAALVAGANQLQLLQSAEANHPLPFRNVLGLMGAVAGALLGIALALLIRVRRGTVKSVRELAELYPQAAVISSADLQEALELEPGARTVIVAGPRGEQLSDVTEKVREALQASTNRSVVLTDSLAHIALDESPNGHINLVTTTLSEAVLRRTSRDEGSVLLVAVRPQVTKLDAVDGFATRMPDRSYLLVDTKAPAWD
jgi:hypothetical protein